MWYVSKTKHRSGFHFDLILLGENWFEIRLKTIKKKEKKQSEKTIFHCWSLVFEFLNFHFFLLFQDSIFFSSSSSSCLMCYQNYSCYPFGWFALVSCLLLLIWMLYTSDGKKKELFVGFFSLSPILLSILDHIEIYISFNSR